MIEETTYQIFEYGIKKWDLNDKKVAVSFPKVINKEDIYDYYKNNYELIITKTIPVNLVIDFNIYWSIQYKETGIEMVYQRFDLIYTNSIFLKQDIEKCLEIIKREQLPLFIEKPIKYVSKIISFYVQYNRPIKD